MKVYISDKYVVEVDNMNFQLFQVKYNEKTKKEFLSQQGYFMNMKHVLHKIIRLESVPTADVTLQEWLDSYNEINNKLNDLVDKIIIEKKLTRKELRDNGENI